MDFKIKDVAELLNVSQTTVRRWLNAGEIPAYRIQGQYRFSRIEIENWVLSRKLGKENGSSPFAANENSKPPKETKASAKGSQKFSLYRALHKGGVFQQVPGKTKEELIRTSTKLLGSKLNVDPDLLAELLLDRENLQPTALNNGLALPHTREFTFNEHQDLVAVVFPSQEVPYGALDGKPVHTLFFLFAGNDKRHLHLLAKIAHLSSESKAFKELLAGRPGKEELLQFVKEWESRIQDPEEE